MATSVSLHFTSSPFLSSLSPIETSQFLFPSLTFPFRSSRQFYRQCPPNSTSFGALKRPSSTLRPHSSLRTEPMLPPYNVLITGSTKGIGFALANEFLKAGDNVLICSRSAERVESAVHGLRAIFGKQHVWVPPSRLSDPWIFILFALHLQSLSTSDYHFQMIFLQGTKCDVREGQDVKYLVEFAKQNLKYIDIWINNAGSNAYSYKPLTEASDEDLIEVVTTNSLGLMICCREAIQMMLDQPRGGHIFNVDGAGSDGRPTPRFAAYGATKRSVVHLTKSLQAELQMQDAKNVLVHNLSPGMVTTDLLMSGATTKQAKFFINVLAEPQKWLQSILFQISGPSLRMDR